MEITIDVYELAHQFNDEDYNNFIVELFANANDGATCSTAETNVELCS